MAAFGQRTLCEITNTLCVSASTDDYSDELDSLLGVTTVNYTIVRTTDPQLVLFSKTNIPVALASVQPVYRPIGSADKGVPIPLIKCRQQTMSMGSNEISFYPFKAILDRDDVELGFVLTNLCPKHLDISLTPHMCTPQVATELRINQVNDIEPGQSYTVWSDKGTQSAMIVGTRKFVDVDGTETIIPTRFVAEGDQKALLFHLMVAPENSEDMTTRFANTSWRVTDTFVTLKPPEIIEEGVNFYVVNESNSVIVEEGVDIADTEYEATVSEGRHITEYYCRSRTDFNYEAAVYSCNINFVINKEFIADVPKSSDESAKQFKQLVQQVTKNIVDPFGQSSVVNEWKDQ
jgi:hypothetical protein